MGVQLNFSQCVFALAAENFANYTKKRKMGPKIQMVLETNGLAFCLDVRHQETKWAHLFYFLLTPCEMDKLLGSALKGSAHEILYV